MAVWNPWHGCKKVSEGCDNLCTYCAIPLIRGRHRSRTVEDIVDEAKKLAELEEESAKDGFWDDIQNSQKVLQRTSVLKNKVSAYERLKADYEDALVMIELADEEEDESLVEECTQGAFY